MSTTETLDIKEICTGIADQVEPAFRVTRKSSCTSHAAKRWHAAYCAARLALSVSASLRLKSEGAQ